MVISVITSWGFTHKPRSGEQRNQIRGFGPKWMSNSKNREANRRHRAQSGYTTMQKHASCRARAGKTIWVLGKYHQQTMAFCWQQWSWLARGSHLVIFPPHCFVGSPEPAAPRRLSPWPRMITSPASNFRCPWEPIENYASRWCPRMAGTLGSTNWIWRAKNVILRCRSLTCAPGVACASAT